MGAKLQLERSPIRIGRAKFDPKRNPFAALTADEFFSERRSTLSCYGRIQSAPVAGYHFPPHADSLSLSLSGLVKIAMSFSILRIWILDFSSSGGCSGALILVMLKDSTLGKTTGVSTVVAFYWSGTWPTYRKRG